MNIRIRVGPSRIAGQGLFAVQDIKKGTRILPYIGEKILKDESTRRLAHGNNYIFELNDRYDIDGKALENTARYINHSCAPNCDITHTTRTIWIIALQDIKAGEELSYNYGYDIKNYEAHPCHCGASICCGYILDSQYWGLIHSIEQSSWSGLD